MANKNFLEIVVGVDDRASNKLRSISSSMRKNWIAITAVIAGTTLAVKKFTDAIIKVESAAITANAKFERWQTTMRSFTKDTKEAQKVLKDLIDFSVKTPFTPEQVIQAGIVLKPLEQLGFTLEEVFTAAGNASASFGLTLEEASTNLARAFSAGIGAADLFREKGIRLQLDLKEGVDATTLSIEKQREALLDLLTSGDIGSGIERLSQTFEGLKSTLEGEIFLFKQAVGEDVFKEAKAGLLTILELVKEAKEEGGKYNEVVNKTSDLLVRLGETSISTLGAIAIFGADVVDTWNELVLLGNLVEVGLLKTKRTALELSQFSAAGFLFGFKDKIREIDEEIDGLEQNLAESFDTSEKDYSEEFKLFLDEVKIKFQEIRQEVQDMGQLDITILGDKTEEAASNFDKLKKTVKDLGGTISSGIGSALGGIVTGAKKGKDAITDLGKSIIQMIVSQMVQEGVAFALGLTRSRASTAVGIKNAAVLAAAWEPAAIFANIASFGAAGAAATASFTTLATASTALSGAKLGAAAKLFSESAGIPGLAEGGIVTRPTVALIGEAGPEAVVPLDKDNGGLTGSTFNITVNNPSIGSGQDVSDLAEQLGFEIEDRIRSGRGI